MVTHLALLSLSLFCVFEITRTYLPRVPGILNVAGLLGVGYAFDTYVPDHYLLILAAATLVAVLDRFVGYHK